MRATTGLSLFLLCAPLLDLPSSFAADEGQALVFRKRYQITDEKPGYIAHGALVSFLGNYVADEGRDAPERLVAHSMQLGKEEAQEFLSYLLTVGEEMQRDYERGVLQVGCPEGEVLNTRERVFKAQRAMDDLMEASFLRSLAIVQAELDANTWSRYSNWLEGHQFSYLVVDPEKSWRNRNEKGDPTLWHQEMCDKFHLQRLR